jgi:hypothetical protein
MGCCGSLAAFGREEIRAENLLVLFEALVCAVSALAARRDVLLVLALVVEEVVH